MRTLQQTGPRILGLLVVLTSSAHAQTTENQAVRRMVLERARNLANEGRHAEALELALRAGEQQMTPSVRMFIAEEHQALRHHAESLLHASMCLQELRGASDTANREVIEQRCRTLLQEAQSHVAILSFVFPSDAPARSLRINGTALREGQWTLPVPVDPGPVQIEASNEQQQRFTRSLEVVGGATIRVSVAWPATQRNASERPSLLPPALVLAGGGVLLGVSLGLFVARDANTLQCMSRRDVQGEYFYCPNEGAQRQLETAFALETSSAVFLGLGLAAAGAGTAWLVARALQPAHSEHNDTVSVVPSIHGIAVRWRGDL